MKSILAFTIFFFLTISSFSQGNFSLEWESPSGRTVGCIGSMENNNQVCEIYVESYTSLNIYDGATHALKHTYANPDTSYFEFPHQYNTDYFFDANNDGTLDIISYKENYSAYTCSMKVLDGANGQVLFEYSSNSYYGYPSVLDIDGDGYLELIISQYNSNSGKLLVYSTPAHFTIGINNNHNTISDFKLGQNYPNPFNPSTIITYSLSKKANVEIRLYDIIGREVRTLLNESKAEGSYTLEFDATGLSSGTYFYQISIDGLSDTKKMVLVK